MAKKQQIILTHGSNRPSADVVKSLKHGELLVQHASSATETALHTVMVEGSDSLVSFPSTAWVNAQINDLDITSVRQQIEGLNSNLAKVREDFTNEDIAIRNEMASAETRITEAYESHVGGVKTALEGEIDGLEAEIQTIETRLDGHDSSIADNLETAKGYTDEQVAALKKDVDANAEDIKTITGTTIPTESTRLEGLIEAANANANGRVEQSAYNAYTGATDTRISGIETNVGNLSTSKLDASTYNTDKAALDSEIETIKNNIAGLDGDFVSEDEFSAEKEELLAEIAKAKTTIETGTTEHIKVTLSSSEPNVYKIEGVNIANADELEALKQSHQDTDNRLNTLISGGTDPDLIDSVNELFTWVNEHHGDIEGSIYEELNELNGTVSGFTSTDTIKKTTDALSGEIDTLEGRVDTLEGKMNTAESDIDTLEGRMATAESGISANTSAIAKVEEDYVKADSALESKLTPLIQANTDKFANYYTKSEVAEIVDSIEGSMSDAESGISANAAAIVALDGKLSAKDTEHDGKISSLESRMDTAEADIDALEALQSSYAKQTDLEASASTLSQAIQNAKTLLEQQIALKADNTALEALEGRVSPIESTYVKECEVTNTNNNKITANVANHKITLNFDAMVIDGGTYE